MWMRPPKRGVGANGDLTNGDERDVARVVDDHKRNVVDDHGHGDQTGGVGDGIVGNIRGEDRFAMMMKKSKRKQK